MPSSEFLISKNYRHSLFANFKLNVLFMIFSERTEIKFEGTEQRI